MQVSGTSACIPHLHVRGSCCEFTNTARKGHIRIGAARCRTEHKRKFCKGDWKGNGGRKIVDYASVIVSTSTFDEAIRPFPIPLGFVFVDPKINNLEYSTQLTFEPLQNLQNLRRGYPPPRVKLCSYQYPLVSAGKPSQISCQAPMKNLYTGHLLIGIHITNCPSRKRCVSRRNLFA